MLEFYKGKVVLITGHTGFKGSWLSEILILSGAKVIGYSLPSPTEPNLFSILKLDKRMISEIGDVRDFEKLHRVFEKYHPEIVFHLAAQPLVIDSYLDPKYTYETNVLGTVNVLECIRKSISVKSFVNITTDKVYENSDIFDHSFKEDEKLDGFDPYSNSKSCSELVTHSYWKSFFKEEKKCAISTARAGNVIGGGDFSSNRIIPDCFRALQNNEEIILRNPNSIRPYQHVLEPLFCYLLIAKKQYNDFSLCGSYNIGPDYEDCVTTSKLADLFCKYTGNKVKWTAKNINGPHEAMFLKLDCSKLKTTFSWKPLWNIDVAMEKIADWSIEYLKDSSFENMKKIVDKQIKEYEVKWNESSSNRL